MNSKELKNIKDKKVIKRFNEVKLVLKLGMTKASNQLGVSRQYLYKWKKRYETEGVEGLHNKSKAHLSHPFQTPYKIKKQIVAFAKANPKLTLQEIANELEKIGIKKHWMTIFKICKEAGVKKAYPKKEAVQRKKAEKVTEKISEASWTKIKKRISDMYKLNFNEIDSIDSIEKKIELLYEFCHFHSARNRLGLQDSESSYFVEINRYIEMFLKEKK